MNPIEAKVVRVIDGDTMWIQLRLRTTANAAELGTQAGDRAYRMLRAAFPEGSTITAVTKFVDEYGRIIATPKRGGL